MIPVTFFEQAAEMVGIVEAQKVGHFADGEPLHQEILGLVDHERVDVADGSTPVSVADKLSGCP